MLNLGNLMEDINMKIIFLKINNSSQNDHMQHIVRNYVGVITYSVVNQNHSIPYQLQLVM